jgi:hypothetical protein
MSDPIESIDVVDPLEAIERDEPRRHAAALRTCETCGNEYDKTFEVVKDGRVHVFDSFECAIQALAPRCARCQLRILGHGLEERGQMYCCAHCASHDGHTKLRDRA